MLLLRLWNYIRGYVIIIVEGYFLEKFVNICIRRQVYLWDIKRHKNSTMSLKISIKGFKLLRPIAKKTGCRVRIKSKRGLPFLLNRYRSRKIFLFGPVLFVLLFYFLSSFIWSVEVTGNNKLETSVILGQLERMGVKPGILKYKVDPDAVSNRMIIDLDEISWINVQIKGTKVKVEVAETVNKAQIVPMHIPCDILASRDGVVKSISVKAGIGSVKVGDTVKKGQILISGTVPVKNQENDPRKVHSIGTVLARTWYESKKTVEDILVEKFETGNRLENISLVLFSKKFGLFHKKVTFKDFSKVDIDKHLSLGENLVFPFGIHIERYMENNYVEREITLEDAKENTAQIAYKEALEKVPEGAEVVSKSLNFIEKEDGSFVADVILECEEDIGYTKEIGGE